MTQRHGEASGDIRQIGEAIEFHTRESLKGRNFGGFARHTTPFSLSAYAAEGIRGARRARFEARSLASRAASHDATNADGAYIARAYADAC